MARWHHRIPAVINPPDTICVPVYLPDDPDYIALFLGTIRILETDYLYQRDAGKSGIAVRNVWRARTITPLIATLAAGTPCGGQLPDEEGRCIEYPPFAPFIEWIPEDPFINPEAAPVGYARPPFYVVNVTLPNWLSWFESYFEDLIYETAGVSTGDVLTTFANLATIGSPALLQGWAPSIDPFNLPGFNVHLSGAGQVELHFISVPLGGRVLITVDDTPDVIDVLQGLLGGTEDIIELDRDLFSLPPEIATSYIHEIEITEAGEHTIYARFLPTLNDELLFLKFGGGLHKIVLCGFDAMQSAGETCEDAMTIFRFTSECELEYSNDDGVEWVPVAGWLANAATCFQGAPGQDASGGTAEIVFSLSIQLTTEHVEQLTFIYDGTPQSIGSEIPAVAPDATEQNALCYALRGLVGLYMALKLNHIWSAQGLPLALETITDAMKDLFGTPDLGIVGLLLGDDTYGCATTNAVIAAGGDGAALDAVACCLLDQLDGITISEAFFFAALGNCALSLTDNAGIIACLMDSELDINAYLLFLEAYNDALLRQQGGETLPCVCNPSLYLYEFDFTLGQFGWSIQSAGQGEYAAGVGFRTTSNGSNQGIAICLGASAQTVVRRVTVNYTSAATAGTLRLRRDVGICQLSINPAVTREENLESGSIAVCWDNSGGAVIPATGGWERVQLNAGGSPIDEQTIITSCSFLCDDPNLSGVTPSAAFYEDCP